MCDLYCHETLQETAPEEEQLPFAVHEAYDGNGIVRPRAILAQGPRWLEAMDLVLLTLLEQRRRERAAASSPFDLRHF